MKQKLYFLIVTLLTTLTSFSQQATHLNFDGIDDHIILLNESNFDFTNQMTVEFWMQSNTTPQQWDTFVAKGDTSWRVSLTATGNVAFSGTGAFADIFSTTSVTDGNWHHVAVTYDGVFAKIYIDGSLESQIAGTSNINNSNINVSLGENLQMTGRKYAGNMDEVRIWNQSRTFSEINASINCELQATETGLVAYYKFNQGIDQANNSSENSLLDSSTNNNNGILKNFTLNGASSNWLASSIIQSLQAPTVTTPINYVYESAATALTAVSGGTGLLWYTTSTGGIGSTTAPTPNTSIPGTTSYWVSSTYTSGCESERVEIVVTVDAPVLATHLNLDGVNDYITLTNESIFDFTNQMTVEFWMNSNILPEQWDALIVKGDDSWRVSMSATGEIAFTGSGAFTDFFSTTSVTDGNWHHVAVTYDGANAKIYIDGVLENQLAGTANINNSGYNVTIGENLQMLGRYYAGNMDEVRIWNVARTVEQINHTKNCELQGTETGLVAYYQFNQGIDQANNASENVLIDSTANNTNGTLSNFALNGNSSNWLASSPVETNSTIPGMPTVTTPVIYNLGETATFLSATVGAGGSGLLWYTTANGGTGNTIVIPGTATVGDTSYWVSSINTNGCESERVEVVVTVNLFASVPTTNWPTQIFTGDDKTLLDLQVTGTAIQWYDASTGGNLLPNTTILVDETTYYATQTIGGLESDLRLAITVKRISDNKQIQSNINTIADLQSTPSSQFTAQWFSTATGGTALNGSDIVASGIYYVEQNKAASIEVLASGLNKPFGIGIQSDGKIVFSNAHPMYNFIKRMNTDGSNIITLANNFLVPYGIAIQSDDKIIIADANGDIKRMDTDGNNIVILGSGFNNPTGVAIQSDGKIVIADKNNNAIKRMNADGSNIEVLGSGFSFPNDVVIQTDGKIVIADTGNGTIKRMDADGSNIVTLITGTYIGLAIQNDGRIVFTEPSSNSVKRMDADGSNVEVLATGFTKPNQIAIQTDGKIVITDINGNLIKRITEAEHSNRVAVEVIVVPVPTTNWTTQVYTGDDKTLSDLQVVGTNIQWYDATSGGNLIPVTTSLVDETTYFASQTISGYESPARLGITVNRISDNSQLISFPSTIGNLMSTPSTGTFVNWYENASTSIPLFAEVLNNGTYYVSQATHSFTTEILGSGFSNPSDVDIQQDGKIIIADLLNNAVKRMNADGTNIEILGTFGGPFGVATQSDGKIIVSSKDFTIKRMNSDGSNIEILLEPDTSTFPAQYIRSYGIAVQPDGKIVFTDRLNNAVKRMNSDGSNIEVLGGGFFNPTGVAIQADGKIIVADNGNNVIKRMNADGTNIETLGTGFSSPDKVEVQANGKIIISDTGNGAVKRMNADGTNIEILSNGFNLPKGIAIESNGNIILAVFGNDEVKRITQFNQLESNRVPVQIIQDCNSTTWNGVSWSNGMPDSNKTVIFDSNYTINADIHACKVEVNDNTNVTLSSGITLTVNNEIVVATNGNLTIENDAIIVQNNPYAINTGNVVVNRNSVPMIRLDYTAWSAPVTGQNLLTFSPNTLTNRFYTYDSSGTNTATSWVSIDPSSTNFSAGVGYLIRVANNWSSVTPASYLGSFNGVPNNGTIANPVGIGYNLIGNPYPSPINADIFIADNASLGVNTIYFWTHAVPQNGSYTAQSNYASYNTVGGVAASAGGVIPDGVIQVGQGFFHNASTVGNVLFNNNQRRGTSNGQFFKSSQTNNTLQRHRIWLSLKDDSIEYNQFLVAYMDGATNGFDAQYDGRLLTNATSTLSSIINNEDYVIQAKAFPFNENDEVVLHFVADHDGNYTISLDNFDGLFGSQDIYLWDKTLNVYHDIKQSSYTFNTLSGSYNNRFSVVYKVASLSNEEFEDQEQVSIFMNNSNQIVIKNNGSLIDTVEIFDLTGRLLYAKTNWGNPELILENNFATDVLLVRTKTTTNKIITRKLIKK